MKKTLVLDIGNVLAFFDFRHAAKGFAEKSSYHADVILQKIEDIKPAYENGQMTDEQFIEKAKCQMKCEMNEKEFCEAWNSIFSENEKMKKTISNMQLESKDNVQILLLSNTSGIHLEWLSENIQVVKEANGGIYSHLERLSKPQAEIYQRLLDKYHLKAEDCWFIDDLEVNVKAAREKGIKAYQYHVDHHMDFERELQKWLKIE
jgi:putative hydrolase of the HAD superfamily